MAQWHLELFGELRLFCDPQEPVRLRTRKTEALLAYLALFPQAHTREHLAGLFWETSGLQEARNSLSVALHALRSVLQTSESGIRPILLADSATVRLDLSQISCDVARFEQRLQDAAVAVDTDGRLLHLQEAIACYQGPLLPAFYDDWAVTERERLETRLQEGLGQAVELLAQRQEYRPALEYALRAAALDPFDEANCRAIMRLHTALGNPHAAMAHYRTFARNLQEEVHVTPSDATLALARQIQPPVAATVHEMPTTASVPGTLDRFFGRDAELLALRSWLEEGRADTQCATLVTLTGIGGVGKTRLAKEVARHSASLFESKIHFVSLAEETDSDCLFETLCRDLRLPRRPDIDPLEQLAGAFGVLPTLLILDNFEQIVEGGSRQIQRLRERMPNLALLVTSRQRLHIAGEREFALHPFPTPEQSTAEEAASLESWSCVQLFVARCRQQKPDFALTAQNAPVIVAICARLEGLPLALELAAAWVRILSPEQLLARLEQRFDLLVSTRRDLPSRHRSLRAAVEGSYRLLSEKERLLFARLAVFAGGWDLEAAQAVCGGDAFLVLAALRDASLVVTEQDSEGLPRFRLLETLREFAAEQLTGEERLETERSYIVYYRTLAEQAHQALRGMEARLWFGRLEAENDNFRAALALCFAQNAPSTRIAQELLENGLRLTTALMKFWHLRGYQPEWERWQKTAYAASDSAAPELRAALYMEIFDGYPAVVGPEFVAKAQALGESLNHIPLTAQAKLLAAHSADLPQDLPRALWLTEEALALLQTTNRQDLTGYALNRQAVLLWRRNSRKAQALFDEAVAILREAEAPYLLVMSLFDAAFYSPDTHVGGTAEAMLREAIDLCVALDHHGGRAHGLWILGKILRNHQIEQAEACFLESLELHRRYGFPDNKALPLFELGHTALLKAKYAEAEQYFLEACAARPALASEGANHLLMWCALGRDEEAAFRAYGKEHLRRMADADEAQQTVGAMQMFAAVRTGNFVFAAACYDELIALWHRNPSLQPPSVFWLAAACRLVVTGQFILSARLLGMESHPSEGTRRPRFPLETSLLAQCERRLRAALTEAELAAYRAEGSAMSGPARLSLCLALPIAP